MKGFKDFLMCGNFIELVVVFIFGGVFFIVVKLFMIIIMDLIGKLGGILNFFGWVLGGVYVGVFIIDVIFFFVMFFVIYFGFIKFIELVMEKFKCIKDELVVVFIIVDLFIEICDELCFCLVK